MEIRRISSKNVPKLVSIVLTLVLILNGLVLLPSCASTPESLNPMEQIDSAITNADRYKASGDIAAEELELQIALDIALENNLPEKREIIETKLSDNSRRAGDSYRRAINYSYAEESYMNALDYDCDNFWPYIGLIIIGEETGDHEAALYYANTLYEMRPIQEAIGEFLLDTITEDEYMNYAVNFNNEGISTLQAAATIDVAETGAGYLLESLAISETLDAAGIENTPTVAVVNNLVSAESNLIVFNIEAGDFESARDTVGNTLEIIEEHEQIISEITTSAVFCNTAIVYLISGDYGIAIEYADASLIHNPDSAAANNIMGATLTALGGEENIAASLPYIEKAVELDPGNEIYQDNLYTIQNAITSGVYGSIALDFGMEVQEEVADIQLVYPIDGGEIETSNPTFEWQPLDYPGVAYNLTIWLLPVYLSEKLEEYGLIEDEFSLEYFLTDPMRNEFIFTEEGIEATSFSFLDDPENPLVPGLTYVWQVTASMGDSLIESYSEVRTVHVSTEEEQTELEEDETTPEFYDEETASECEVLEIKTITLEWQDLIKDNDWDSKETLANQTHSISITLTPPDCTPRISREYLHKYTPSNIEDGTPLQVLPSIKDNDPQSDDTYHSTTSAIYFGDCVYILSYSFYGDHEIETNYREKIIENLDLFHGFSFSTALVPLIKSGSSEFGTAEEIIEQVKTLFELMFKNIEKVRHIPWAGAVAEYLKVYEFGYVVTIWEICGEYIPCSTCELSVVNSFSSSHLGDTDHYIKRQWSFGDESGLHENQGEKY